MLRKLHRPAGDMGDGKLERKRSKRQRLVQFFKPKRLQPLHDAVPEKIPTASEPTPPQDPANIVLPPEEAPERPSPIREKTPPVAEPEPAPTPTPTPAPEPAQPEKIETLGEAQLHALFSGAPHFSVTEEGSRRTPTVSYPQDRPGSSHHASDSTRLDQPAFAANTLHPLPSKTQQSANEQTHHGGYEVGVVELPSMLSAQGIEPGSIGFSHFLELPKSDSLLTELEGSQSSKDFLQGTKNKELMQTAPDRIGIRAVDMSLVYDRLIEIQDLCEAIHDSPGPMTILNHQSSGDLYANLFSKFLTPPGYDGTTDDPTGLRVQILTLMRILKLKGIWYDFSLVEWRIRLGQILWTDPEPVPEHEPHPLWTEREVLLLQITLACELLLRLDAVTNTDADVQDHKGHISTQEIRSFFGTKTRKLDWDLVLARTFLDNILVVRGLDHEIEIVKSRGLLSMLGAGEKPEIPISDIVLLPRHQARQLTGLMKFSETIQWPSTESLLQEMVQKLGAQDVANYVEQVPSSGSMFTPASVSVYGTPLETPLSANHLPDGYFGHIGKPVLSRNNSHSLRIPLSPSPVANVDQANPSALTGVGGWLSRSYLTGLVLPGEPISHFLISTLLENDKTAIARLGDSANLYGGFSYANRAWWSKNSIVGRVFACTDGAAECMGWISFPKIPEGLHDRWHSIHSEQLPLEDRLSDTARSDAVTQGSAIIPSGTLPNLRSEDLVLPRDPETTPTPSFSLSHWELTPLNPDLIDNDMTSGPPTESDIHVPSVIFTFQDGASTQTLTLAFDVQFITSWPCNPPTTAPAPSMPHILKRSVTGTVSRTSSKRSGSVVISRRNSHGFEPLLSHPPDSADIAPKPVYSMQHENDSDVTITIRKPMDVHPLHMTYKYQIVQMAEALDPDFEIPFDLHRRKPSASTLSQTGVDDNQDNDTLHDKMTVLVLDTRSSKDLQLLARAWCAEKGFHAIIGRTGRTCISCCVREARALGINIVIRV